MSAKYPTGLREKGNIMKKVLTLVIVIVLLMSSLVSCYIPIREANIEDIYCELNREWSADGKSVIYTFNLQVNEKIKDLVLQINFETDDGEVIKTFTLDVGRVVPGNQYSYRLDVSDISVEVLKESSNYRTRIVDGYVVIP